MRRMCGEAVDGQPGLGLLPRLILRGGFRFCCPQNVGRRGRWGTAHRRNRRISCQSLRPYEHLSVVRMSDASRTSERTPSTCPVPARPSARKRKSVFLLRENELVWESRRYALVALVEYRCILYAFRLVRLSEQPFVFSFESNLLLGLAFLCRRGHGTCVQRAAAAHLSDMSMVLTGAGWEAWKSRHLEQVNPGSLLHRTQSHKPPFFQRGRTVIVIVLLAKSMAIDNSVSRHPAAVLHKTLQQPLFYQLRVFDAVQSSREAVFCQERHYGLSS